MSVMSPARSTPRRPRRPPSSRAARAPSTRRSRPCTRRARPPVGGGDGDHDRGLADPDAADAVVDRDRAELVARVQAVGDLRHHLLGHSLVGLVVEVGDGAVAGVDAGRAGERRDRARLVVAHLVDDALERERLVAEQERAAGDGRDQRDLVAVGERAGRGSRTPC